MNIDPYPSTEETSMSPPSALAMFLLTARPSPTPSLFICLFDCIFVNGVNNLTCYALLIPTPVSSTMINKRDCSWHNCPISLTYPVLVYFTELETRLMMICLNRFASVEMYSGND